MMGFSKYADVPVEAVKVLSPEEHADIEKYLRSIGKISAVSLTAEERQKALNTQS